MFSFIHILIILLITSCNGGGCPKKHWWSHNLNGCGYYIYHGWEDTDYRFDKNVHIEDIKVDRSGLTDKEDDNAAFAHFCMEKCIENNQKKEKKCGQFDTQKKQDYRLCRLHNQFISTTYTSMPDRCQPADDWEAMGYVVYDINNANCHLSATLPPTQTPAPVPPPTYGGGSPSEESSSEINIGLIAGIAVSVLVFCIGCCYFVSGEDENTSENETGAKFDFNLKTLHNM